MEVTHKYNRDNLMKERDRVRMTRAAIKVGLHQSGGYKDSSTGIVISVPAGRMHIRVLRDDRKTIEWD